MLLLVAVAWLGGSAADAAAQSSLRYLFEEAAAAVKSSTLRTPFADDPQEPREADAEADAEAEWLPPPMFEGRLPLAGSAAGEVHLSESGPGLITLRVRDASLSRVLALLAQTQDLNIVAANDIDALISITLRDVPLEEAMTAILSVANYTWVKRKNIILITSLMGAADLPADVQGRQIQVFELDFASAREVAKAIEGFKSPIGKVTVSESSPTNNRLTRELVIVEDLPEPLARIAEYVYQVDQPPRQVLIEAHILEVTLTDVNRHGIKLEELIRVAGRELILGTPTGLLDTSPAFVATLADGQLNSVIQLLQTTNDTKSLGSPKILVLNGQEARIHVGRSIGIQTSTTTELTLNQAPDSEEVGVKLNITPRITRDHRVLLHVHPEVSDGVRNEVGAVDKTIADLETDVMLHDGQGVIIGGLIQETDSVTQSKIPYLGDVKGIGWFFRRSEVRKERRETIFALVPRIQPYDCQWATYEQGELVRASVPLFYGPLSRTDRPWDPVLPDGERVYRPLVPKRHGRKGNTHFHNLGPRYVVPPYPLPEQYFYGEPCDAPRLLPPVTPQPRGPFLSEDDWTWDDVEMIPDRP